MRKNPVLSSENLDSGRRRQLRILDFARLTAGEWTRRMEIHWNETHAGPAGVLGPGHVLTHVAFVFLPVL